MSTCIARRTKAEKYAHGLNHNQCVADHKEAGAKKDTGLHYRAEDRAKAAKALADQIK